MQVIIINFPLPLLLRVGCRGFAPSEAGTLTCFAFPYKGKWVVDSPVSLSYFLPDVTSIWLIIRAEQNYHVSDTVCQNASTLQW